MANDLLQPGIRSDYTVSGPAAGVMADKEYANYEAAQGRIFRDSDLQNQIQQNKYQNDLLDNPVLAAQRDLKTQQIAGDVQALPSKIQETIAKQEAGKTDAQIKQAEERAGFLYSSAQAYPPDLFTNPDPSKQARAARIWEEQKSQAKELGVKFPQGEFNADSYQELQQRGQASGIYLKHRQAMDLEKSKEASAEKISAATNASREKAAQIAADAAFGRQQTSLSDPQRLINEMQVKVNKGEPITEDDINKVKLAFKANRTPAEVQSMDKERDQLTSALLADPKLRAAKAKANGLPEDSQPATVAAVEYEKKLDDWAKKQVMDRFPGIKASKVESSTTTKPAAKKADEGLSQADVEKFGVTYNKNKIYRIGPNGKLQAADR